MTLEIIILIIVLLIIFIAYKTLCNKPSYEEVTVINPEGNIYRKKADILCNDDGQCYMNVIKKKFESVSNDDLKNSISRRIQDPNDAVILESAGINVGKKNFDTISVGKKYDDTMVQIQKTKALRAANGKVLQSIPQAQIDMERSSVMNSIKEGAMTNYNASFNQYDATILNNMDTQVYDKVINQKGLTTTGNYGATYSLPNTY